MPCLFNTARVLFSCQQGLTFQASPSIVLWVPVTHRRQIILSHKQYHLNCFRFPLVASNLANLSEDQCALHWGLCLVASETCYSPRSTRQMYDIAAELSKAVTTWCSSKGRCQVWKQSNAVCIWSIGWCCLVLLPGKNSDCSSLKWIYTDKTFRKSGTLIGLPVKVDQGNDIEVASSLQLPLHDGFTVAKKLS